VCMCPSAAEHALCMLRLLCTSFDSDSHTALADLITCVPAFMTVHCQQPVCSDRHLNSAPSSLPYSFPADQHLHCSAIQFSLCCHGLVLYFQHCTFNTAHVCTESHKPAAIVLTHLTSFQQVLCGQLKEARHCTNCTLSLACTQLMELRNHSLQSNAVSAASHQLVSLCCPCSTALAGEHDQRWIVTVHSLANGQVQSTVQGCRRPA
jgi:hypothetical protein